MGQALELYKRSRLRVVGRKYSPERLRKFLDTFARTPVMKTAALAAGFCVGSAHYYLEKSKAGDPGFVITWRNMEGPFHEHFVIAEQEGVGRVEHNMFVRANGYQKPLTHQGRVQYQLDPRLLAIGFTGPEAYLLDKDGKPVPESVEEWDRELMMFIMKARRPEVYGNKPQQIDVRHTKVGVLVVGTRKTAKELEEAYSGPQEIPEVEFTVIEDEPPGVDDV